VTTTHDEATLQRLVDRLDIQDTMTMYATASDAKDFVRLRACFTDDARARYGVESEWLVGGDQIVAWLGGAFAPLDWGHHLVSVYGVDIEGDQATALMYLLSHQTVSGAPDEVLSMTAKYRNTLRRSGGRWQIAQLDLEVGWFEARNNVKEKELSR
jgi:ketosteroid isomerase-like protein